MLDCRVDHEEPTSVVVMVVRLAGIEPTTLGFGEQNTNYVHLVILLFYTM
jgi:hypothetical protein